MSAAPLLRVSDLGVAYGRLRALDGVDFEVQGGEALAIVGESGSGKSTAALAVMGLLGPEATVTGTVAYKGRDLAGMTVDERRDLRGRAISIVFQDPFTSLNPSLTIGLQVMEPLLHHLKMAQDEARRRAIAALAEVGLQRPEALLSAFPHQLSGGMQQRVLIAMALVCDPDLVVFDEPTTALDVTVEARILDLLDEIRRRRNIGMLFITHNLGVVNRIADRVCVIYAGRIAEIGRKDEVLGAPAHPYTKGLLASLPRLSATGERHRLAPIGGRFPDLANLPTGCVFADRCPFVEERCRAEPQALVPHGPSRAARCWKADALRATPWPSPPRQKRRELEQTAPARGRVSVEGLSKTFTLGRGGGLVWGRRFGLPWPHVARETLRAVDGVTFSIEPGEVLGLVGESGSGKSTLARLVLRLIEPSGGRVAFDSREITGLKPRALASFRKSAQIVFQNPDSSLNPRRSVGDAIARAVTLHTDVPAASRRAHVEALLDSVGLPAGYYGRYPHQLSGGEKQRVGIARALATDPAFVVCDEPVSALDVSVQATVLNLLGDLRDKLGLSYLFISHDLSVVAHIADRIAVMYAGRIVEIGPARAVLTPPYHPYTEALLSAIPMPEPELAGRRRVTLRSDAAGDRSGVGCPFHTRCPRKLGAICETRTPPVVSPSTGHHLACHIPLAELSGVASVLPKQASRPPVSAVAT
jgi:peptide/nickel transport system ATP-binding protein